MGPTTLLREGDEVKITWLFSRHITLRFLKRLYGLIFDTGMAFIPMFISACVSAVACCTNHNVDNMSLANILPSCILKKVLIAMLTSEQAHRPPFNTGIRTQFFFFFYPAFTCTTITSLSRLNLVVSRSHTRTHHSR